jgi:hypothetical protein
MAALVESKGERAKASRLYKSLQAELLRTVVLIERLAPKLDGQAAKHEEKQGRPELAAAIRAGSGEEALAKAGGLHAVVKPEAAAASSSSSSSSAAKSEAKPVVPDAKPVTA